MTENEIGEVLKPLLGAFPTLAEFYRRNRDGLRSAWLKQLEFVSRADAAVVIDQIIGGEIELPPNYEYDRTAVLIRREANQIASRRNERNRINEKYLNAKSNAFNVVRKNRTGNIAVQIGEMVKRHEITREQNDKMMEELLAWDKGGDEPSWMKEMFLSSNSRSRLALIVTGEV